MKKFEHRKTLRDIIETVDYYDIQSKKASGFYIDIAGDEQYGYEIATTEKHVVVTFDCRAIKKSVIENFGSKVTVHFSVWGGWSIPKAVSPQILKDVKVLADKISTLYKKELETAIANQKAFVAMMKAQKARKEAWEQAVKGKPETYFPLEMASCYRF